MISERHSDSGKKKRRRRRRRRISPLVSVLLVFLCLVLLLGGSLLYFSNRFLNQIGRVDKTKEEWLSADSVTLEPDEYDDSARANTIDPSGIEWTRPEESETDPHVKNILLIGQDARPGETRARSDSMIICSINQEKNRIVLISLMRDMFVPYPGDYEATRINHSYVYGGMSLLDQIIEEDFGIHIDGNVEVDFDGFIDVMNMVGPLEITLKDYEVGYMNRHTHAGFNAGPNLMNGEQLLVYARMRHVGHADWERTERQRTVLRKAFNKVRHLSIRELFDLADTALPCMSTDLSNAEIMRYIYTVAKNRMSIEETYRLPVEGTYTSEIIYGMDVLVPDLQSNSILLHRYIYGD